MERIKIIISEPWDFESPDGENILISDILISDEDKMIIKSHYPFMSQGITGNVIKLTPRIRTASFKINTKGLSVNGGLFKMKSIGELDEIDDDKNYVFAFIGHIAEIY